MRRTTVVATAVLAIAGTALFLFFSRPKANNGPADEVGTLSSSEAVAEVKRMQARDPDARPGQEISEKSGKEEKPPEFREILPIDSEAQFDEAFANLDLFNRAETTVLVERLRKSDEKKLAAHFQSKLVLTNPDDDSDRSRIVFLAEAWGSDSLLPFWKDLAFRETSRFKDEKAAIFADDRTLQSGAILQEMQAAISHLGILGSRNKESLDLLQKIVLEPKDVHSEFIRERAFYALREADAQAGLMVLRSLDDKDPLRKSLQRP